MYSNFYHLDPGLAVCNPRGRGSFNLLTSGLLTTLEPFPTPWYQERINWPSVSTLGLVSVHPLAVSPISLGCAWDTAVSVAPDVGIGPSRFRDALACCTLGLVPSASSGWRVWGLPGGLGFGKAMAASSLCGQLAGLDWPAKRGIN